MADETINMEVKSNIGEVAEKTSLLSKATDAATAGVKKLTVGFGSLLKATGFLRIIDRVFRLLKETVGKNQVVVDAFSTSMNFLNIVVSDLFKFLENNVGTVVGYFKSLFEDPVKSIKDFSVAITTGLIDRFNQLLEVFGYLGRALAELVTGQFGKALETVKEAGRQTVDVFTGVDESFNDVADSITEYTTKTIKSAKATTELNKAVDRLQSSLDAVNIEFERQALVQEQIIDNELLSFDDRYEALEKLTELTKDNNAENLKAQELLVQQARQNNEQLDNEETRIALQKELNKLAQIRAKNLANEERLFDKLIDINNDWNQSQVDGAEVTEDTLDARLQAFSKLAGALSSLAGDNKELAAASAIIDTYAGANKAFAQGGVAGFATGAAIIASGLANLKKIYATDIKGEGGGGRSTANVTPAPQMMSGAFELTGGVEPEPLRAFVLTDEMTNSQNQLANIRRRATI